VLGVQVLALLKYQPLFTYTNDSVLHTQVPAYTATNLSVLPLCFSAFRVA
jgi:hypothetical protein